MVADSMEALVIARVLDELRFTAAEIAAMLQISRELLEAYIANPVSTPYPIRGMLAALLQESGRTGHQVELGRLLGLETQQALQRSGAAFRASLADIVDPEDIERRYDAFLSSALMRHPGLPPGTCESTAARLGMSKELLIASLIDRAGAP